MTKLRRPAAALLALALLSCQAAPGKKYGDSNFGPRPGGSGTVNTSAPVSGNGSVGSPVTIASGAVGPSNVANVAADSLMGNPTGSPASYQAIALGAGLSFSGSTLLAASQFGTDTTLQLADAASSLVNSWEGINTFTSNVHGATTSQWQLKLQNLGTFGAYFTLNPSSLTLASSQILMPNGSTGAPAYSFTADASTGLYRQNTNDLRMIVAGSTSLIFQGSGILMPVSNDGIHWISTSNSIVGGGNGFRNVIITGGDGASTFGDVQVGSYGALGTTATAGFLDIPTCAGTPTGTPSNISSGKVALVYDTTDGQLCAFRGAAWHCIAL